MYDARKFDSFRFKNVGIFITSKKNLPFKFISSLLNDGVYPVSFTIKIYYTNETWNLQMGIHPNAETDFSLYKVLWKFTEKYDEIEVIGHDRVASILHIDTKDEVEKIVKNLIKVFKDVKLIISDFHINSEFKKPESHEFYISSYYSTNIDDSAYKKFINIINELHKNYLDENEIKKLQSIRYRLLNEKFITEKSKNYLNTLMKKYLTEHERISIAMKYLYNKK